MEGVFRNHVLRLAGKDAAVRGLPLDLVSTTLLVLLTERESEGPVKESGVERYTAPALVKEFSALGMDAQEGAAALESLMGKDMVVLRPGGYLSAAPSLVRTREVLDALFPKMTGLQMVGYYVQTLEEVLSGRKDLEDAVSQFDQALSMHGASRNVDRQEKKGQVPHTDPRTDARSALARLLKRSVGAESPPPEQKGAQAAAETPPQGGHKWAAFEVKEVEAFRPKQQVATTPPIAPSVFAAEEPETEAPAMKPSAPDDLARKEGEPSVCETGESAGPRAAAQRAIPEPQWYPEERHGPQEEQFPDSREGYGWESPPGADSGADPQEEAPAPIVAPVDAQPPAPASLPPWGGEEPAVGAPEGSHGLPRPAEEEKELDRQEPFVSPEAKSTALEATADETVDEQVLEFEQTLSLYCPLCRSGRIRTERTASGKTYYMCDNRSCYFISWGRPHHVSCPLCHNTFLVEAQDHGGERILKCPRATCRHREYPGGTANGTPVAMGLPEKVPPPAAHSVSLGKPARRVVKRRVVRRRALP